jgi:hypothetical protein
MKKLEGKRKPLLIVATVLVLITLILPLLGATTFTYLMNRMDGGDRKVFDIEFFSLSDGEKKTRSRHG